MANGPLRSSGGRSLAAVRQQRADPGLVCPLLPDRLNSGLDWTKHLCEINSGSIGLGQRFIHHRSQ